MYSPKLLILLFCLLCNISAATQAEIYKWTDDKGRVFFSDKAPQRKNFQEISAQISETGNFFGFEKVKAVDVYVPNRDRGLAKVNLDIELVNFELSDVDREKINVGVRKVYQAFINWFGWPAKPTEHIKIKIFGRYNEFEDYQKIIDEKHVINRSFYNLQLREIVMLGSQINDETMRTLFHEATHAIFHMQYGALPVWINEGLAMVFSGIDPDKKGVHINLPIDIDEHIKAMLAERSLQRFGNYLAIDNIQWRSSGENVEYIYYRVAWSMMMFMLSEQKNTEALESIIAKLNHSEWWAQGGLAAHFAANYPGGLVELDKRWRNWIRKSR